MGDTFLSVYGTEFEDLDDEAKESVGKKPLPIHEQEVTDERGRRRFHGAFTGGFSAGYFNTVGTKEGWKPREFRSSRIERSVATAQRPEDYMDTEDLGEFGIAPQQVQTTRDFDDQAKKETTQKRQFAWEHGELSAEASRLAELIKPVSDSFGVRLLKRMGWRQGKGIGPRSARKLDDNDEMPSTSANGQLTSQRLEFAPEDVDVCEFLAKTDTRGLGYEGLSSDTHVLQQKYTQKTDPFKTAKQQRRGVRGQAFGVGVFEDDDDDIYTREDLSKYDFSLGGPAADDRLSQISDDFTESKHPQASRQFYAAPKLPRDYNPNRRKSGRASAAHDAGGGARLGSDRDRRRENKPLSRYERAHALGSEQDEKQKSVMSYLKEADRKRLQEIIRRKTGSVAKDEDSVGSRRVKDEPSTSSKTAEKPKTETINLEQSESLDQKIDMHIYVSEPAKHKRFVQFVNYISRGLTCPQPIEMTEWEWEKEMKEFETHLPDYLKATLPSAAAAARARQRPLANPNIAAPLAHLLTKKFTTAKYGDNEENINMSQQDDDRVQAVKLGMFGTLTRTQLVWHPDKALCKRMNVPEPYPGSTTVGCPALQATKDVQKKFHEELFGLDPMFPSTAQELTNRHAMQQREDDAAMKAEPANEPVDKPKPTEDTKPVLKFPAAIFSPATQTVDAKKSKASTADDPTVTVTDEAVVNRPSMDLFRAVFGDDDDVDNRLSEGESSSDEEEAATTNVESKLVENVDFDRLGLTADADKGPQRRAGSPMSAKPITLMPVDTHVLPARQFVASTQIKAENDEAFGPALPPESAMQHAHDDNSDIEIVGTRERHRKHVIKREPTADRESSRERRKKKKHKKDKKKKHKHSHKSTSTSRRHSSSKSRRKREKSRSSTEDVSSDSD